MQAPLQGAAPAHPARGAARRRRAQAWQLALALRSPVPQRGSPPPPGAAARASSPAASVGRRQQRQQRSVRPPVTPAQRPCKHARWIPPRGPSPSRRQLGTALCCALPRCAHRQRVVLAELHPGPCAWVQHAAAAAQAGHRHQAPNLTGGTAREAGQQQWCGGGWVGGWRCTARGAAALPRPRQDVHPPTRPACHHPPHLQHQRGGAAAVRAGAGHLPLQLQAGEDQRLLKLRSELRRGCMPRWQRHF